MMARSRRSSPMRRERLYRVFRYAANVRALRALVFYHVITQKNRDHCYRPLTSAIVRGRVVEHIPKDCPAMTKPRALAQLVVGAQLDRRSPALVLCGNAQWLKEMTSS